MELYYVSNKGRSSQLLEEQEIKECALSDVTDWLDGVDEFGVDIETSWKFKGKYNYAFAGKWGKNERNPNAEGLDPKMTDIVMIQVGHRDLTFVVDARDFGSEWIKPYLEDPTKIKFGQNLKFEYKHFRERGIIIENMYDTMIAEKVLYTGQMLDFSLAGLISRYMGIQVDKSTRLEFALIGDTPFTYKQILYGAEDISYPARIMETQRLDMLTKQVDRCFSLEMGFLPTLADIEFDGMHFNQEVWAETYQDNLKNLTEIQLELNAYVIDKYSTTKFVDRQLDMFSDGYKCRISWRSTKQVVEFFKYLYICPMDKHKPSLNAKVVATFLPSVRNEEKAELIRKFLRYKKLAQATSTFGLKFFKYIHPLTGRLYSNYNQVLSTGRISSSSPNLQNIPALPGFRKAFDAPTGWKIVNADYSGQEQIILANKSEDPELQQFYFDGHKDMHSFIASKIYPEIAHLSLDEIKSNHKDKRQIAKAAGFAINYGGTGYTIAKNLGISEAEGDAVYDAYFVAFPNLKKYFDKVQRVSLAQGYILIDPITRRKNWFRPPENKREESAIKRNALNYPIQGEAGGITKVAPMLFRKWIIANDYQDVIRLTNLVHDEINVEAKEGYEEVAAKNLEECMSKAADIWCKTIKLSAEAVISDHWSH
tara:strand:- start:600 stop:2552 length:1953 start_codon:yes stop_codon:yes gene_type:complete